jgi:hypothetical protein
MGQLHRNGVEQTLGRFLQRMKDEGLSAEVATDEVMGLLDALGWYPADDDDPPRTAHKMVPLIRRDDPPYLWAGDPDHNGVELKDGDTVEIIVGGELVRGRLKVYGELLTLRMTVDMDVIALEKRSAAGESIWGVGASHASPDWESSYGFQMPDCILLRKVEV